MALNRASTAEMTEYQRGNRLAAERHYKEAIAAFEAHAEAVPGDRANAFERIGYCWENINSLEVPITRHPAATLVFQSNRVEAAAAYRRSLDANPDHPRALKALARLLPQEAEERGRLLERACSVSPDVLTLSEAGDYYRTVLKDHLRARSFYVRAVELNPKDRAAYLKLIDLTRRFGHPDEASEWSRRLKNRTGAT